MSGHKYRAIALFLMISGLLLTTTGMWTSVNPPASADDGVAISPDSGLVKGGGVLDITGPDLGFPTNINGYNPVPYIQFGRLASGGGDAFIDTGIPFKKETLVTTTFSLTSTAIQQTVWGAVKDTLTAYVMMNVATSTSMYASYYIARDPSNNYSPSSWSLSTLFKVDQMITLMAGNGKISLSDKDSAVIRLGDEGSPIRLGSHNASFFTGRVYSFTIEDPEVYNAQTQQTTPRTVLFDGVPAWDPNTKTYGMYDNVTQTFFRNSSYDGAKLQGTILGPDGPGGPIIDPKNPPFAVTFTGQDGMGNTVSVDCTDATVLTNTHATCTIPPSMFGGDGGGEATVTVAWKDTPGVKNTSSLTYKYIASPPTVTSLIPSVGPMTGGGRCTVTGTHFVTLLDALGLPNQVITEGGPAGSRPAAWTEHDKTVYGWFNPDTQGLSRYDDVDGTMFGILAGVPAPVSPTLLTFGVDADGDPVNAHDVTVRSGLVLTCGAIPAHAPGPVDVTVTINDKVAGTLVAKFEYTLVGDLQVVKKGWLCPEGWGDQDVGPTVCTPIPDGGNVVGGTMVTWTYTTTFVSKNALGQVVNFKGAALSEVTVYDDKIGYICTHDDLVVNTAYVCSATNSVDVPVTTD